MFYEEENALLLDIKSAQGEQTCLSAPSMHRVNLALYPNMKFMATIRL